MINKNFKILIIAGEESGDSYGAGIMNQLIKINSKISFKGTGGNKMINEGLEAIYHINELNYIGYTELIWNLKKIFNIQKNIKRFLYDYNPDLVILIDYPGFNINFAKYIKKRQDTKIIYFIPPSVWAWKEKRIIELRKWFDYLIVIFPFEEEYYKTKSIKASYFGCPLYHELSEIKKNRSTFNKIYRIKKTDKVIAVMLSSRKGLFKHLAPVMINSLPKINKIMPNVVFYICFANSIPEELKEAFISKISKVNYKIIKGNTREVLAHADFAICTSGTVCLEAAILQCPMLIYLKLSRINTIIAGKFFKGKWIGLPNIISNKTIINEYYAENCTPTNIVYETLNYFKDKKKSTKMKSELKTFNEMMKTKNNPYCNMAKFLNEKYINKKFT